MLIQFQRSNNQLFVIPKEEQNIQNMIIKNQTVVLNVSWFEIISQKLWFYQITEHKIIFNHVQKMEFPSISIISYFTCEKPVISSRIVVTISSDMPQIQIRNCGFLTIYPEFWTRKLVVRKTWNYAFLWHKWLCCCIKSVLGCQN